MSKMDALRAMREARYEQMTKAPTTAPRRAQVAPDASSTTPARAARPAAKRAARAEAPAAEPGAAEALCGHRNMGGRTCTRELGHTAKSHRYS